MICVFFLSFFFLSVGSVIQAKMYECRTGNYGKKKTLLQIMHSKQAIAVMFFNFNFFYLFSAFSFGNESNAFTFGCSLWAILYNLLLSIIMLLFCQCSLLSRHLPFLHVLSTGKPT
jgi:hypothetical protein